MRSVSAERKVDEFHVLVHTIMDLRFAQEEGNFL